MSLYEKFKNNSNLEKDGVDFEIMDAKFKLARMGGSNDERLKRAHAKHYKKYTTAINKNLLPEDKLRTIVIKTFCEGCLLGWENVKDEDGNVLEYNLDNATKLFKDLPDLFQTLNELAQDSTYYRENYEDSVEELGNS